jgi:hypothetical protein
MRWTFATFFEVGFAGVVVGFLWVTVGFGADALNWPLAGKAAFWGVVGAFCLTAIGVIGGFCRAIFLGLRGPPGGSR